MPSDESLESEAQFLKEQLITYLGNKRSLLPFISQALSRVVDLMGGAPQGLRTWDAFSGSGVVARLLKSFSSHLYVNDLESYSELLNSCYLSNADELNFSEMRLVHSELMYDINTNLTPGFVAEYYAPLDDECILPDERVFYTRRNAVFIDSARAAISRLDEKWQKFFLAPLLSEASIHTNTSGVFKGFYKNAAGVGQFGGKGRHALSRILGEVELPFPVFSGFICPCTITRLDALEAALALPDIDVAYLDPPYNQHPYGSNYFMLNLIVEGMRPDPSTLSRVSGIPRSWNRSPFNCLSKALDSLRALLEACPARFVLLSYNSEGVIPLNDIRELLISMGRMECFEQNYAAYKASRNLHKRKSNVTEYIFLLEKGG